MTRVLLAAGEDDATLATARALRRGLQDLHLTILSHAPHGAPVHADVFDAVWTAPSWDQLDPNAHANSIADRLAEDTWVLPCSPAEVHWSVEALPSHRRVLVPPPDALIRTTGPDPDTAGDLPVSVPDQIPLSAPIEELHAFGRKHDWGVWIRAPLGVRQPLEHWSEFDQARSTVERQATDTESLFLQQRIQGASLAMPFAASGGDLLSGALVRPAEQRHTCSVRPIPDSLRCALADCVTAVNWTGGGTLHLIEDESGTRWLDTWRPCFGSDVDGIAQCGVNPPAQLIGACTGTPVEEPSAPADGFARVATSIPTLESTQASEDEPAPANPPLPARTRSAPPASSGALTDDLEAIIDDLPSDWNEMDTPRSLLLPTRTKKRFEAFVGAADRIEDAFDLDTARVGLSIKTNPADRLLATARDVGMLAETIHSDEMAHARRHDYSTGEIIVNGPVQALLRDLDTAPYALFGDAVQDLRTLPFDPSGSIVGVRTRPPERGPSRFGVDLTDPDRMDRLCARLATLPTSTQVGLHLHAPSSTLGHNRWWDSVARVLDWAQTIQDRTGRPIECLDLGGGWHPDDWLDVFVPGLLRRRDEIQGALPALKTLLLEPGKALSQPLGVVMGRVLDSRPSRSEVILDASLAELSNIDYHPHRLLAHTDDRGWHRLPPGEGRLLGRLCMEADILGQRRSVDHLSPSDTVVICDAGAYDASMTYPFGRGRSAA